jgi:DNA replication protein DnaC
MTRPTSELAHLFRQLKAPAAARALPNRAREEEWTYERFAAALLKTETDSRDSHGGQSRIKAALSRPQDARVTRLRLQHSIPRNQVLQLGQLDFLAGKENVVPLGLPGTGKTHLSIALGIRACLAGHRVAFRTATEWVALLADAQRHGRLDGELDRLQRVPLLIVDEVGYILRFARREPDVQARLAALRSRLADRHVEQALLSLGRDLRSRDHRRRDDRAARSPRRDPRPQRRPGTDSKTATSPGYRPNTDPPPGKAARAEAAPRLAYGLTLRSASAKFALAHISLLIPAGVATFNRRNRHNFNRA